MIDRQARMSDTASNASPLTVFLSSSGSLRSAVPSRTSAISGTSSWRSTAGWTMAHMRTSSRRVPFSCHRFCWSSAPCRTGGVAPAHGGAFGAAVVGVLLAALYDPVFTSAVRGSADMGVALVAFALLIWWKWSPLYVVLFTALGDAALALPVFH